MNLEIQNALGGKLIGSRSAFKTLHNAMTLLPNAKFEVIPPPADSIDLTDDEDQTCQKKRRLDDPKLEKRVEDLEERLSKLEEKATVQLEELLEILRDQTTQKPPKNTDVDDEDRLPPPQERLKFNPNIDTARAADALIKGRSDIYAGREVWVYKKTRRSPGVIKKVNIVRAIVTMANSQGIQANYDVPFTMLGLREH